MQIQATQLRVGTVINHQGELWRVASVTHITPGNWRGMVQTKLRNVIKGSQTDHRFRSEDRVEKVSLEEHEAEYLYNAGDDYHFMNTESYEQFHLTSDDLGDAINYLIPNLKLKMEFHDGKPIGIELPKTVDLEVVETEPGLKGATASNSPKPAKLETGVTVSVPPFVNAGDKIRVDTTTGEYLERAK
ncbi:MAG: elongation factor P [Acidobacteriota bacterium]